MLLVTERGHALAAEPPHLINQDASALSGKKASFTFAVIGDNRSGEKIYGKLAGRIAGESPAFVVNTGDTVFRAGSGSQWKEFVELSAPIKAPHFIVPGNHDVNGRKSEALFQERVRQPGNELYYSFTAGNALFVVLDTEEPDNEARIAGEQYTWLEGVLKGSHAKFRFVFMHRPMYPVRGVGRHYKDSMNRFPADRDRLEALFEKHGVDAVFCGHEHMYQKQKVGGIYHIVTGGGGAPLYEKESDGGFHHYVKVTVGNGSAEVSVIGLGGDIKDSFTIPKGR
ncbi:MAG: metallophosphoesterase [Nitrospirae bacterium]|nr:metallophosphoesterase [Nitrospirota bacterium]